MAVFKRNRGQMEDGLPLAPASLTDVRPVSEDPEVAAAAALLAELRDAYERLTREKETLSLQWHFSAGRHLNGASADGPRDRMLRERLRVLQAKTASDPTPLSGSAGGAGDPDIDAALAIANGGPAPKPTDQDARRREVDAKIALVEKALSKQGAVHDALIAQKSRELSAALQPSHDAMLTEILHAAQRLSRLVDGERDFRAQLIKQGYSPASDLIGPLAFHGLLVIGSERDHDSGISNARRQLEARGIA